MPQLALDNAIMLVGVVDHTLANLDVLVERLVTRIDHDTGKSLIDAVFAQLEGVAMIQMDGNGDSGETDRGFDELFEVDRVGIRAGASGNLQHHRGLLFFTSFDDGL